MAADEIVGVILAGGRSTRMGTEKALMPLSGWPMLAHVVGRLAPQVSRIIVSANGDPARFAAFGLPVVPDALPGRLGPLAGLHAAMRWVGANATGARKVLTVPVDTPFIPGDFAERLKEPRARVAVAASSSGVHPPVALWNADLADAAETFLRSGAKAKVSSFAVDHTPQYVFFEPCTRRDGRSIDPFFNVNTPEDALVAEAFLRPANK